MMRSCLSTLRRMRVTPPSLLLLRPSVSTLGAAPTLRSLSTDSHPDFAPQRKDSADAGGDVLQEIDAVVKANPIVLFMKGTPVAPQCGFSAQVVRILDALGAKYAHVNVLADAEIREGIKQYSEWPTIPQLYVDDEFVGGCDIVVTMFQNGELEPLVDSVEK